MTDHEEFLEILRVLVEIPPPAGEQPPSAESRKTPGGAADKVIRGKDNNYRGAA